MSETKEQVVELDAAAIEAIAKQMPKTEVDLDALADKMHERAEKAAEKKEASKLAGKKEAIEGEVMDKYAKMSKEEFAVAQVKAALGGNNDELAKLNSAAIKSLQVKGIVNKATYLNAGTGSEGGYIVPNDELLSDILNVLPEYNSVAGLARVINLTVGDGIDIATLTADVTMTEVGSEGGSKDDTKPTLGTKNVNVREFAGIAIMTKKLVMLSAVDVYGLLRDSFARAIAKKREQLLLTDATSGLINTANIVTVNAGGSTTSGSTSVADITVKEVKTLPFQVPTASAAGGTYVISRLLLAELAGAEDTTGQPIMTVEPTSAGSLRGTLFGFPFVVAETLGTSDAVSTVHAAFGNWGRYAFVVRHGAIDSALFDSGVVNDGSADHNLINENKLAMRVETWENAGFPIPGAFAVLKTAAS